jgi:hypothetical protein
MGNGASAAPADSTDQNKFGSKPASQATSPKEGGSGGGAGGSRPTGPGRAPSLTPTPWNTSDGPDPDAAQLADVISCLTAYYKRFNEFKVKRVSGEVRGY